ncbi:MAG TPA: hypothetical protein VK702_12865 [Candidatus Acidoferrum sp.]|nr:hypothetical protein [Candidatus Acidoferrum sp.]
MTWDELLDAFRSLGGIADNVRLGDGQYGRGIFSIDPSKPVTLHTPNALQVRVTDIEIRDGQMRVKPDRLGIDEREFFEAYEASFGWGAGGYEESLQRQLAWSALPVDVIARIKSMGGLDEQRFLTPTVDLCLQDFFNARKFGRSGANYAVPLIDLVNYSSTASGYTRDGGFGVKGTFADEVLVCYSEADAWSLAAMFGFTAACAVAYSIGIAVALPDGRKLSIMRDTHEFVMEDGVRIPIVQSVGADIRLSYLALRMEGHPDLPRGIFRRIAERLSVTQADAVFDGIVQFNRNEYASLLGVLGNYNGPLVRMLEQAVTYTLGT